MFLEQVVQNAKTLLGKLQELSKLRIEFEQIKEDLFETHNCLQTCSLKLDIVKQTLNNCDKKLVIIKRQVSKVQHEN